MNRYKAYRVIVRNNPSDPIIILAKSFAQAEETFVKVHPQLTIREIELIEDEAYVSETTQIINE